MWAMSVLGNAKSDSHRKTHQVEPGGTGRKYMLLPGETSDLRGDEESAEAVVALTPVERQEERRAEESRKNHSLNLDGKARRKPKRKGAATAAATEAPWQAGAGGT